MGVTKWLLAVSLAAAVAGDAPAAFLPTLFGTGLKADGTPAGHGDAELHYTLLSGPVTGVPFVFTEAGGYPMPPDGTWLNDSSPNSRWITPTADTFAAGGIYTYRTTFDLTGFAPGTASLSGRWAMDDEGLDILLNGVSLAPTSNGFGEYRPFGTTDGGLFRAGTNTLDFVVFNAFSEIGGSPTGLRVEVSGDATPNGGGVATPLPPTVLLAVFALGVAAVARRRRG